MFSLASCHGAAMLTTKNDVIYLCTYFLRITNIYSIVYDNKRLIIFINTSMIFTYSSFNCYIYLEVGQGQ